MGIISQRHCKDPYETTSMESKGPRVFFFVAHAKIYFAIPRNPGKRWKSQQNNTHSWLHVRNFCLPIVSMHDIIKFDYSACCHKKRTRYVGVRFVFLFRCLYFPIFVELLCISIFQTWILWVGNIPYTPEN